MNITSRSPWTRRWFRLLFTALVAGGAVFGSAGWAKESPVGGLPNCVRNENASVADSGDYRDHFDRILAARQGEDRRELSRELGRLSGLYEESGQSQSALALTWEAIAAADARFDQDLLVQWEWRLARLQTLAGETDKALAAYRRALRHLAVVRFSSGAQATLSYSRVVEPLHLDLVALLLQQAEQVDVPPERQRLLAEAQQVTESLRAAELRDYFRDACAIEQTRGLDRLPDGTAALVPVLYPDRVELLLQIGAERFHHTARVDRNSLTAVVNRLARSLRLETGAAVFPFRSAEYLYTRLVAPFQDVLQAHSVATLIYLPDGPLRKIPLDALWDGHAYVLEHYSVVVVPGLSMIDSGQRQLGELSALVAGMSQPGAVIERLPDPVRDTLLVQTQGSRGLATRGGGQGGRVSIDTLTRRQVSDLLTEILALPGVGREVEQVSDLLPSKTLLDDAFDQTAFEQAMTQKFRIVHIASHGLFTGNPDQSFIMTHDALLNMNDLERLFKPDSLSAEPVELLVLSACQTAEGDDRSPLGLSGIAIRSGVRSAIGSLWPVVDEAAQRLFADFYQRLRSGNLSPATALREAKLDLLHERTLAHPGFWSPFILIGNWR